MQRYSFPKYHFFPSIQCKLNTYFYDIYIDLVKKSQLRSVRCLHCMLVGMMENISNKIAKIDF